MAAPRTAPTKLRKESKAKQGKAGGEATSRQKELQLLTEADVAGGDFWASWPLAGSLGLAAMAAERVGACPGCEEEEKDEERREAALRKLIVRLKNVQEGKQIETLVQILQDLFSLASQPSGGRLFHGKNIHVPLLLVLVSYMRVASVQQDFSWTERKLFCSL